MKHAEYFRKFEDMKPDEQKELDVEMARILVVCNYPMFLERDIDGIKAASGRMIVDGCTQEEVFAVFEAGKYDLVMLSQTFGRRGSRCGDHDSLATLEIMREIDEGIPVVYTTVNVNGKPCFPSDMKIDELAQERLTSWDAADRIDELIVKYRRPR